MSAAAATLHSFVGPILTACRSAEAKLRAALSTHIATCLLRVVATRPEQSLLAASLCRQV